MNLKFLMLIGGFAAAAFGGVRYWLTRGRASATPAAPGTSVPEGTEAEKAPKKES